MRPSIMLFGGVLGIVYIDVDVCLLGNLQGIGQLESDTGCCHKTGQHQMYIRGTVT